MLELNTFFITFVMLLLIAVVSVLSFVIIKAKRRRQTKKSASSPVCYPSAAVAVAKEKFFEVAAVVQERVWLVAGEARVRLTKLSEGRYAIERVTAWETWPPKAGQRILVHTIVLDPEDSAIDERTVSVKVSVGDDDDIVPPAYDPQAQAQDFRVVSPESLARLAYQLTR